MRVANPDDPFADIPTDNVVPFREAPGWVSDVPPYDDDPRSPKKPRDTTPLPIQYFDEIQPQYTGLWLLKGLLPSTGMAVLYGHPGSGKTFLALDWALHIAWGRVWQGRKVKQGVVLYVAAEGVSGLRNRVEAFRRHHDVKGISFALVPTPIDMQAPDADVDRLIAAIRQAEEHVGERAALIVIDTISKTFGSGKENTDDMVTYVANCQRVSNEFECLVMPVHHRPKDAESEDPRGHSSLKGGSETVIIVEAGETKKLRVIKQKDGDDGIEILFRLKVIELGLDEDGEPVTSCVVEPTDVDLTPRGDAPECKIARLPDNTKLALKHLDEALIQSGFYPPNQIPDTVLDRMKVGKVVKLEDWRDKSIAAAGTEAGHSRDTGKRAFNRALTRLQNDGIVRVWNDYAWRTWVAVMNRDNAGTSTGTNNNSGPGQPGQTGFPLKGETPAVSRSCPEAPGGDVRSPGDWQNNPLLNPNASPMPPAWFDEIPPLEDDRGGTGAGP